MFVEYKSDSLIKIFIGIIVVLFLYLEYVDWE